MKTLKLKKSCLAKSRFNEMFGTVNKRELSSIAEIFMGQSPDSKSYNDLGNGIPFFQGKADYGEKYTKVAHWTTSPTKLARQGDVLMSVRAPVGPVNISSSDCCIGRGLCAIRAKEGVTNNEFLYNALKVMESEISSMGNGSTFKAINKNDVYGLKIPSASIAEQEKFSTFSELIDKSRFVCHSRNFL
ncbi:MAG: restriction endonuclease subunit S [Erysipelotrichaceae bacterium]|nr:restriction endonuclease subunit S [Erysipelotrichaceae bacterium]